jgi:hypothetical protein
MNENRTRSPNGSNLTQPRSPAVLRDLLVKRNKVGRNTRAGRLLSNLIGQVSWQDDPDSDRSWAKHPTQNLPWLMNVQVEALARGK